MTISLPAPCTATFTQTAEITINHSSPSSMWLDLSGPNLAGKCQQVTFNAQVTGGVPPYIYTWNMGDADCPSCSADCLPRGDFEGVANESATFSETGFSSNPVCVTVTDANGNSEFKCLDIKVKDFVYPLEMNIKGTLNSNGDCYLSNSNIIFTPDIDPLSSFEYPTNYYWEFEKDYQLMPLEEVEAYIAKYHHLPGTPSADKVEENGSFELGETTINHQVKIEEVFLHLIELEEETKALESVLFLHETLNRRWIK